jgi:hypothetical protein
MNVYTVINVDRGHLRVVWLRGLVVAIGAGIFGCQKADRLPVLPVYEVTGKVVLADGKPLTSGLISFVPKGDLTVTPSGFIRADGNFSLVTGGSGEGAPAGEYKVRVEAPQLQSGKAKKKPVVPVKYTDEDSSGIVVTVRVGANHLEPIQLK